MAQTIRRVIRRRDHERRLLGFARRMRREQTDAEKKLWSILRSRQLAGFKFRRQYPVAGYIVDYVCLAADIVIEADGGQHLVAKPQAYDERRTVDLAGHGLRVIRFSDVDILNTPDVVANAIYHELETLQREPSPPPSSGVPGQGVSRSTDGRRSRATRQTAGFTLVELLVLIGIIVILLSIFIPYLLKVRESSRRVACAQNLYVLLSGLQAYARDNAQAFPRVAYDEQNNPSGYVAFTGARDDDPFAGDGVRPNDVTASLWLLVRQGYVVDLKAFVCPSSGGDAERLPAEDDARLAQARTRGNFAGPAGLTYSYASPFSSAAGYRMSPDILSSGFALLADANPGTAGKRDDVTAPPPGAPPLELARANSNNHDEAGQNVLYAAGYVEFKATPYAGVDGDNIYTAQPAHPPATTSAATTSPAPPPTKHGVFGVHVAPASIGDSFLVPSDDQTVQTFAATRPTTSPATTRATTTPTTPTTTPAPPSPPPATTVSPGPATTRAAATAPTTSPALTAPPPPPEPVSPATQPPATQPAPTQPATTQVTTP